MQNAIRQKAIKELEERYSHERSILVAIALRDLIDKLRSPAPELTCDGPHTHGHYCQQGHDGEQGDAEGEHGTFTC